MDNIILSAIGKAFIICAAIVGILCTYSILLTEDRLLIRFYFDLLFLSLNRF